MLKDRVEEIEHALRVFPFGKQQDLHNLFILLKDNDISIDEFEEYIAEKKKPKPEPLIAAPDIYVVDLKRPCPECGGDMSCFPVNHRPEYMVGHNDKGEFYRSQWMCMGKETETAMIQGPCGYEEFSTKRISDHIKKATKRKLRKLKRRQANG